ncbi:unnamed protein product [Diamesa serratosioi]
MNKINSDKVTIQELKNLEHQCIERIKSDELYQIRNDAKIRAVNSTKNYDEFKDIVDAAHLKPLSREEKMNSCTKRARWNPAI